MASASLAYCVAVFLNRRTLHHDCILAVRTDRTQTRIRHQDWNGHILTRQPLSSGRWVERQRPIRQVSASRKTGLILIHRCVCLISEKAFSPPSTGSDGGRFHVDQGEDDQSLAPVAYESGNFSWRVSPPVRQIRESHFFIRFYAWS